MWIKRINEFFENMSEYDNNSLVLHVALDLIDMLKERITFELDDESNMTITVLKYGECKEDCEVDEEGFMYWLHFTFHKELVDIILSLRPKYSTIQESNKTIINDIKLAREVSKKKDLETNLEKNNKELEALEMIMNKVDTYRRNTFTYLRDKEDVDKMISYIRIYKEQSD
tara:strand:+ start:496 stop:1008 length:513 start_codon:yes stop_codon:yes gene_type:complete